MTPFSYGYIDKAIRTESDEKYLPRYCLLKGELETVAERIDDAKLTLERAKELVEKYVDFWNEPGNYDVVKQINVLLEKNSNKI